MECLVRCERESGEQLLCRFRDEMSREKLLKLMNECCESAGGESGLVSSGSFLS